LGHVSENHVPGIVFRFVLEPAQHHSAKILVSLIFFIRLLVPLQGLFKCFLTVLSACLKARLIEMGLAYFNFDLSFVVII